MRPGENPEAERVSGYRVLSDEELQLVNDIKALGPQVEDLIERASGLVENRLQADLAQLELRLTEDVSGRGREAHDSANRDHRAKALARTNFQQGAMWLIRAVAAPDGLF